MGGRPALEVAAAEAGRRRCGGPPADHRGRGRIRQRRAVRRASRAGLPAGLGPGAVQDRGGADHGRPGRRDHRPAHRLPAARGGRLLPVHGPDHPARRHRRGPLLRVRGPRPGRRALELRGTLRDAQDIRRLAGAVEPHGHQPRPAPGAADGRGNHDAAPRRGAGRRGRLAHPPVPGLDSRGPPRPAQQPGADGQGVRRRDRAGLGAGAQRDPRRPADPPADPGHALPGGLQPRCARNSAMSPGSSCAASRSPCSRPPPPT